LIKYCTSTKKKTHLSNKTKQRKPQAMCDAG
jgi:hypothetical protein